MSLSRHVKARLRAIVGPGAVVDEASSLSVYECDGYTLEKARPELVVLPSSTEQVSRLAALLHDLAIPYVPRGAGTGVSGGCLPAEIPVMIGTSRMRRIRSVDLANRRIEVEAGVVNLEVTRQVESEGYYYAPDPSSQPACTIGGNIAENSGGPHTLKYGVTVNHLLGLEMVLPNGEVVRLERSGGGYGYDLAGLVTGSEGTFGIVTAATLALSVKPEAVVTLLAVFPGVAEASRAVSAVIAAGVVPAAMEMMDSLVVEAVEAACGFGFPADAGAVLLIELDGLSHGLETLCGRVEDCCRREGATSIQRAADEKERELLWRSRKQAFGAMGRLAPAYCTQDGVVPRSRLPEIVAVIARVAETSGLRIANLMHAGDGNIHPLILYDDSDDQQVARVLAAGVEILKACIAMGGSVTGEHGIGVEKIGLMASAFSADDLSAMTEIKKVFNPADICNPHKILPTSRGCTELRRPRPRGGG